MLLGSRKHSKMAALKLAVSAENDFVELVQLRNSASSDFVINRFDIEIKNPFPHLKPINPFKNNEFIKYQFSLAKMDLSYNKMSQNNYSLEEDNALALFKRMDKSRISLDLLNDAGGFNSALEQIEKENKHQMNRSLGQKHFASF